MLIVPLLTALVLSQNVEAQDLPVGSTVEARVLPEQSASYRFRADGPGGLALVLRAGGADDDLAISVAEPSGQELVGGYVDHDENGRLGDEQGVVTIPEAGEYTVFVDSYAEGPARFTLAASFLPMEELAPRRKVRHASPDDAIALRPGEAVNETVRPLRDEPRDWYVVTPDRAGTLTIRVVGDGDVILERFAPDEFRNAKDFVDNDDNGEKGRETMTASGRAGVPVYVRVTGWEASDYRISAELSDR